MAFYGCEFTFDGIPCSQYGLMVYDFNSAAQTDVPFQTGEIVEDRISRRYDSLMYGLVQNKPLEYTLVFGANPNSASQNESIDRFEAEVISSWLTGHSEWKWLTIVQPDMELFGYKCIISELTLITYGRMPWAFSCKVICDSPFAYTYPEEYEYVISGERNVHLFNRSSYNGFYCPKIEITMPDSGQLSIVNHSDGDRVFSFKELPSHGEITIEIDNKNQIITNNLGINLYPYFNYNFFRMVRGDNLITLSGNALIKFICEFPVNVGG